jgi:hypothetical protein
LTAENVQVITKEGIPATVENSCVRGTFCNITSDGTLCASSGKSFVEQSKGTVIPSFACYSTKFLSLSTTLTTVTGLESALFKLVRTYSSANKSLEQYRADRTPRQINVLEEAIAEAEKSLTYLPGVTDEVSNINNELSAARTAYINNVVPTLRGDADGNGEISLQDAMFVANAILGNPNDTFDEKAADANLDGEIGMSDVMYIVNYVLNGKFPEE